jgi:hemerythrin-like domain-containing protein
MTTPPSQPNLARDLLRIHRAISRALIVSAEKGAAFVEGGFPDAQMQQGFALFIQSLTIVLAAHHLAEDEIAFPFLSERLPEAPYERLAKNHKQIDGLLDPLKEAIPALAATGDPDCLKQVVDNLGKIADIWRPHIQTEEWYFTEEALSQASSPDEQARVGAAMGKHTQEHAVPPALAVPFVLYNLEAEDRAVMSASLPRQVLEELLPKVWKAQWAAMQPFLLDPEK